MAIMTNSVNTSDWLKSIGGMRISAYVEHVEYAEIDMGIPFIQVSREALDELHAAQRAKDAYVEWQEDPTTARPYEEVRAEMVAEGRLNE